MSNINLLPWRETRIFHKNNVFYLYAAIVAIIGFILTYFVNVYLILLVETQNGSINFLNKEIVVYQEKIKEINGLKERKDMTLSRAEVINSLQAKRAGVIAILDSLTKNVPDGIVFEQIAVQDNILTIKGSGDSTSRVSLFMRNVERSTVFSSPALQEIKSSADHSVSFVLTVKVVE